MLTFCDLDTSLREKGVYIDNSIKYELKPIKNNFHIFKYISRLLDKNYKFCSLGLDKEQSLETINKKLNEL